MNVDELVALPEDISQTRQRMWGFQENTIRDNNEFLYRHHENIECITHKSIGNVNNGEA